MIYLLFTLALAKPNSLWLNGEQYNFTVHYMKKKWYCKHEKLPPQTIPSKLEISCLDEKELRLVKRVVETPPDLEAGK